MKPVRKFIIGVPTEVSSTQRIRCFGVFHQVVDGTLSIAAEDERGELITMLAMAAGSWRYCMVLAADGKPVCVTNWPGYVEYANHA